jgi:hypothetical protein
MQTTLVHLISFRGVTAATPERVRELGRRMYGARKETHP